MGQAIPAMKMNRGRVIRMFNVRNRNVNSLFFSLYFFLFSFFLRFWSCTVQYGASCPSVEHTHNALKSLIIIIIYTITY